MNDLDEILTEYRKTCFLVRDNMEGQRDKSISLMAHQNINTKNQLKTVMLEMMNRVNIDPAGRREMANEIELL
jgi:hypothetical protein